MSTELSTVYRELFNQLKEGNSVEIVCNTSEHLARVRAALKSLKKNYDETMSMFPDLFDAPDTLAGKQISIKRKEGSEFVYIISTILKEETSFVILDIKTNTQTNASSPHNNGSNNHGASTIPT
jgi:hypothetical protein